MTENMIILNLGMRGPFCASQGCYVGPENDYAGSRIAVRDAWRSVSWVSQAAICFENLDQFVVSRRKLQRTQLLTSHPAHLLPEQRRGFTGQAARQEVQLHALFGIGVRHGEDLLADRRVRAELLPELPPQAI